MILRVCVHFYLFCVHLDRLYATIRTNMRTLTQNELILRMLSALKDAVYRKTPYYTHNYYNIRRWQLPLRSLYADVPDYTQTIRRRESFLRRRTAAEGVCQTGVN